MIDYPPILQGSTFLQLQSLRDYLVRMAEELQTVSMATTDAAARPTETISGYKKEIDKAVEDNSAALKSLITKTAAVIQNHVDAISTELHTYYLAASEFGTYQEQVAAQFTATASNVTEAYNLASTTSASHNTFMKDIQGEIRRGLINDPDTGERVVGIAISQKLRFDENGLGWLDDDNNYYAPLASAQTFAIYTSTGWQYWIDGRKVGWFASDDSSLHANAAVIGNSLQVGTNWVFQEDGNGFGVRFIG